MDTFERHAHATQQARKFMQAGVAVRYCAPDENWWKVILEAAHPADPRVTWTATGRAPDEISARQLADAEMLLRAYRHYADPAAGLRQLEVDRRAMVFIPGAGDSVYHVRKALKAAGVAEHMLPSALAMGDAYQRIARDGTTVGDLVDELLARPTGGQGKLIA